MGAVMRFLRAAGRLWLVPVVLVAWEVATRMAEDIFFPPPTTIAARMHELWFSGPAQQLWLTEGALDNIPTSLGRIFAGWLLAGVIGTALGIMLGRSERFSQFVDPLIQFGRAIPPPALLPFFLALFAVGAQMQIATIVFGIIWPILLNAGDGARHVDRLHLETAAAFGLSRGQRLTRVILPSAMPKIFAGLRLSLSLALILMVISELVGSTNGIGFQLLDAQRSYDYPGVWGSIVLLGVLGYLLNAAFLAAERRILSWHRTANQTT
ncbi:ABC transporter permease [Planobispora takensis]|uniref:Nitrate ABC transporter permease n=1 Tax=Planobispora takensis TaxID=1367882 RepID=A0A8J3SVR8_9ACTN|nr:ABC transporter permease [Planobispora takensis]GII01123.1 nitrate ABC transporter permease [Planobispora takensis]